MEGKNPVQADLPENSLINSYGGPHFQRKAKQTSAHPISHAYHFHRLFSPSTLHEGTHRLVSRCPRLIDSGPQKSVRFPHWLVAPDVNTGEPIYHIRRNVKLVTSFRHHHWEIIIGPAGDGRSSCSSRNGNPGFTRYADWELALLTMKPFSVFEGQPPTYNGGHENFRSLYRSIGLGSVWNRPGWFSRNREKKTEGHSCCQQREIGSTA